MLYDVHALVELPSGVVSNVIEGDLQTVVYDLSIRPPWNLHMALVQVTFFLFSLAWGVLHWRSFVAVAVSLWACGWFAWQTYDTWTAGNVRDDGKLEWIPLLVFFLLIAIICIVHEYTRRTAGNSSA